MKKQKCPKCGATCIQDAELVIFACNTEHGTFFNQSALCRERVKNAKLKKQVEKLKMESKYWRDHHDFMQEHCNVKNKQLDEFLNKNTKF